MTVEHENMWTCPPWCDVDHDDDEVIGDPELTAVLDPDYGTLHGRLLDELVWEPFDGTRAERSSRLGIEVQQFVNGHGRYPLGVVVQVNEDDGDGTTTLSAADARRLAAALLNAADYLDVLTSTGTPPSD